MALATHLMASAMTPRTQKICYQPSKLPIYPMYSTFSPSQPPPTPFTFSTFPKTYFIISSLLQLSFSLILKPLLPLPLPLFLHTSFLPHLIYQYPKFSNFQLWHKRELLVSKVWFFGNGRDGQKQQNKFEALLNRDIITMGYANATYLHRLGLLDNVNWMINIVGLYHFYARKDATYDSLTREFLSSFIYTVQPDTASTSRTVQFKMFNKEFAYSTNQLSKLVRCVPRMPLMLRGTTWFIPCINNR